MTNSDLKLATLVLHEATLLGLCSEANMATYCSESDNTPTSSCITRETSTIKPVVADLLRIHMLHPLNFFLNPSFFYHPGQGNRMSKCHISPF